MTRKPALILIVLLACALLSALPLRVIHSNDTHGAYLPRNFPTPQGNVPLGGYGAMYEHLRILREGAPRSVYLDAGDQQTGTAFAALEYNGAVGGAVIEVFNHLRPDATTFGNHEFDHSLANLKRLVQLADYPFVSSNLIEKDSGKALGGKPWYIIHRDGISIGVMGLTLTELPEKVKIENVANIEILDYTTAINRYLDDLDRQTDLIVILTHNGWEADSLLATQLDDRVDMIIGGHTHTYIDGPKQVNGIYILQSGSYLSHIGYADIDVVEDRIVSFTSHLVPLTGIAISEDNPVAPFVSDLAQRIESELGTVIGSIPVDWVPDKYQETEVSRWMAHALKAEYQDIYHPDLAIVNCGGFRKVIPAGEVTLRDMHEMLPFNNTVVVFSCWGRDLIAFDDLNWRIAQEKPYDICQSTMPGWDGEICKQYEPWGLDDGWQSHRWSHFDVGPERLQPNKVYQVISHDYVAGQWQKYLGFQPFKVYDTGELFLDAMIRQVKLQYPVDK